MSSARQRKAITMELQLARPRNAVVRVLAGRRGGAGSHEKSGKQLRQQAKSQLAKDLRER